MPTDPTPEPAGSLGSDDALARAIDELAAERAAMPGEPPERYWLRLGIALGLRQPGRAALLLGGLEAGAAPAATRTPPSPGDTVDASPTTADDDALSGAAAEETRAAVDTADDTSDAGDADAEAADAEATDAEGTDAEADEPPVRSRLLARSAALPASSEAATVFGWVEQISPIEIRRLGLVVGELIARGEPRDLERGFGLAWSAGTRLPREDLRHLFGRFAELELAVCGALGGRDLLSIVRPPDTGVSALLSVFVRPSNPAATEASAILEREGEAAKRGLVAIWNAWIALRYRELIAPPLFNQLVQPWVTVVGSLPAA